MVGPVGSIAVTGSAGSLGSRVVRALAADTGVGSVVDIPDDDPAERLTGVDALVHLAWAERASGNGAGRGTGNVSATRRLLEAAGVAGVRHVVHLSSATVYGAWPDNPVPLAEAAPVRPNAGFAYAVEKAEAERLVADWREDHAGATTAVLRPAISVAGASSRLAAALAGVSALQAAEPARPLQFLHEADLAAAVVLALRARLDGPYNVAPDGWVSDETARALAGGPARLPLPRWLGGPLRAVAEATGIRPPWPGVEPYTRHPWVVANDRLRAAGWEPTMSNEEAFVDAGRPGDRTWLTAAAASVATVAVVAGAAARRRRTRRG